MRLALETAAHSPHTSHVEVVERIAQDTRGPLEGHSLPFLWNRLNRQYHQLRPVEHISRCIPDTRIICDGKCWFYGRNQLLSHSRQQGEHQTFVGWCARQWIGSTLTSRCLIRMVSRTLKGREAPGRQIRCGPAACPTGGPYAFVEALADSVDPFRTLRVVLQISLDSGDDADRRSRCEYTLCLHPQKTYYPLNIHRNPWVIRIETCRILWNFSSILREDQRSNPSPHSERTDDSDWSEMKFLKIWAMISSYFPATFRDYRFLNALLS
jgi:hypothetical protein